jgi:phosphoadenosine phosphosulfate reductase
MLKENTLFGEWNKIEAAVARIKEFAPIAEQLNPAGYYVCVSGGKDSSVIQELCIMAGVKCEFVHNFTTVDFPETARFLRREKDRLAKEGYTLRFEYAVDKKGNRKTMWNMIAKKGFPTMRVRWCCKEFKEYGGKNRYCITGVRWEESAKRKKRALHETKTPNVKNKLVLNNDNSMKRRLVEMCPRRNTFIMNPVIDWTEAEVWEFIRARNVPYNPLYDLGYKRVGCVGCPFSRNRLKELNDNPEYRKAYIRAGAKFIERRKQRGMKIPDCMESPEKYFNWWIQKPEEGA